MMMAIETFLMQTESNRRFTSALRHSEGVQRTFRTRECNPLRFNMLSGNQDITTRWPRHENRYSDRLDATHKNWDHRTISGKPKSMGGTIESYCDKGSTGNRPLFDLTKSDLNARFLMKLNGSPSRPKGIVETTKALSHPSAPITALNVNRGEICLAQIFLEEVR